MWWILACVSKVPTPVESVAPDDTAAQTPGETVLALSGYWSGDVHLYSLTGDLVGVLTGVDGAQTVVLAPDGTLVACAEERNELLRFDARTYAPLDPLLTAEDAAAAGLAGPTAAVFGPDGALYVASFDDDRVLRFAADGRPLGVFLDSGAGGLDGPDIGMSFGPDGDLYVPGWDSAAVHRFDGVSGAPLGVVVSAKDGLSRPRGVTWDAEGRLYVADNAEGVVFRHDATSGAVEAFFDQRRATGLWFGDDTLFVANDASSGVKAVDPATGESLGGVIDGEGVDGATALGGWVTPS